MLLSMEIMQTGIFFLPYSIYSLGIKIRQLNQCNLRKLLKLQLPQLLQTLSQAQQLIILRFVYFPHSFFLLPL